MTTKPLSALDRLVIKLVDAGNLPRSSPHECPYLDDRSAIEEGFLVESLHAEVYHDLMDRGFRRSGSVLYRPRCEGCAACVPLRIPVADFVPSRSQRRVLRRNRDLTLHTAPPRCDEARATLYRRYLEHQHPGSPQSGDEDGLKNFLYTTCVDTLELTYHDPAGKLIGVSILDASSRSLSSVYHFFDPDERRRSLGVFSVLAEIQICQRMGVPYYYLGYWIEGSRSMDYKALYYPHEVLKDGAWVRVARGVLDDEDASADDGEDQAG